MKPATDTKFGLCNYPEQVLKIGRDFQNKDGFRGAHYDTVKLLCDTIEHQQEQLKAKTEAGDCAKLREALAPFPSLCDWLVKNAARLGILDMVVKLRERGDKARAALAAPPPVPNAEHTNENTQEDNQ